MSMSIRGRRSTTDFNTATPDISRNVSDAEENPSGVISLALAENVGVPYPNAATLCGQSPLEKHLIHGPVTEFMNKNFNIDEDTATTYNGTALGGPRLRKAMAKHINKYFSPSTPVDASNVLMANGVSAICSMLGFVLGNLGDGVLRTHAAKTDWGITAEMKTLHVNLNDADPFSEETIGCYEKRMRGSGSRRHDSEGVAGLCYPKNTLVALMRFCSKHNIHLIGDKIYPLTIFPTSDPSAAPFTSFLSISTRDIIDPALVHVEYGLAKDFGAAGLHLSGLITRNPDVSRAFEAISILYSPGGPSCHIGARVLEDEGFVEELLKLWREGLAENYRAITEMLDMEGIPYWRGGNAGYFLWIYLPPETEVIGDEEREKALAKRILDGGVWLNPRGELPESPGWFRLIFSHPKGKVLEGVRRQDTCAFTWMFPQLD